MALEELAEDEGEFAMLVVEEEVAEVVGVLVVALAVAEEQSEQDSLVVEELGQVELEGKDVVGEFAMVVVVAEL